jgi:hypothetical protein
MPPFFEAGEENRTRNVPAAALFRFCLLFPNAVGRSLEGPLADRLDCPAGAKLPGE